MKIKSILVDGKIAFARDKDGNLWYCKNFFKKKPRWKKVDAMPGVTLDVITDGNNQSF